MPRGGVFPLLLLLGAGCATGLTTRFLNNMVARGEFSQAAARVEASQKSYGTKDALLFDWDRALLLQWAGDPAASNAAFESAKRTLRRLITKSVTADAATFLLNESVRPYPGEDFETALMYVFGAVNYALLGRWEDALVECRQLDFFLKTTALDRGARDAAVEDAFALYWAGLMYEEAGEINDAHISYMKALDSYDRAAKRLGLARPAGLLADAWRTAQRLGFSDALDDLRRRGAPPAPAPPPGTGELVVLHLNGVAPHKVDSFFEISVYQGWPYVEQMKTTGPEDTQVAQARGVLRGLAADKMVRVAVPAYQSTPYAIRGLRAQNTDGETRAVLVEDIGAAARQNLKDRLARTYAKTVARAVVKFLLTQKISSAVEDKKGEGAGRLVRALLQAATVVTETADKRGWRTLPDQIFMARLPLRPGAQNVTLNFTDANGTVVRTQTLENLTVRPGHRTFAVVRTAT